MLAAEGQTYNLYGMYEVGSVEG